MGPEPQLLPIRLLLSEPTYSHPIAPELLAVPEEPAKGLEDAREGRCRSLAME